MVSSRCFKRAGFSWTARVVCFSICREAVADGGVTLFEDRHPVAAVVCRLGVERLVQCSQSCHHPAQTICLWTPGRRKERSNNCVHSKRSPLVSSISRTYNHSPGSKVMRSSSWSVSRADSMLWQIFENGESSSMRPSPESRSSSDALRLVIAENKNIRCCFERSRTSSNSESS